MLMKLGLNQSINIDCNQYLRNGKLYAQALFKHYIHVLLRPKKSINQGMGVKKHNLPPTTAYIYIQYPVKFIQTNL